ncbi:Uncharacterised protein [[Clostridium] sordellii]|uniref:hypothetical protein n=1 Tax=Paraclostridium sordellii TaxID=1505 RepID=UPI0005DFFFA5|nr:hypothetical protein [Paeniclostridium sordellii]CEQ01586.1 Uncharacterised protein [[Clostridium] sordellii] [Paeniclostridium sordellii]
MSDNAKVNMVAYMAYAIVWISVAVAISVAIYITRSATPLWGFLFPGFVSLTSSKN